MRGSSKLKPRWGAHGAEGPVNLVLKEVGLNQTTGNGAIKRIGKWSEVLLSGHLMNPPRRPDHAAYEYSQDRMMADEAKSTLMREGSWLVLGPVIRTKIN